AQCASEAGHLMGGGHWLLTVHRLLPGNPLHGRRAPALVRILARTPERAPACRHPRRPDRVSHRPAMTSAPPPTDCRSARECGEDVAKLRAGAAAAVLHRLQGQAQLFGHVTVRISVDLVEDENLAQLRVEP